ncbi:MAG: redoxin family protein, partial [Patescibacteria group bacterium]
IATLAATRAVSAEVFFVTLFYVTGVGIPLFVFAISGQKIATHTKRFNSSTGRIQQLFGLVMIITALLIATGYDRTLQAKLLNLFPSYSNILYKLESAPQVKTELDRLKNRPTDAPNTLSNLGMAPEFAGISNWLNSKRPLTMQELRGRVVLVDFWTYTCINCIRTLPYIKEWHKKYASKGLVVIGVHTPEFEFEKKKENVQNAISQYELTYPVAQDNNYSTWNAFNNQYWPAKYLIDKNGTIRYTHFGEGNYEETERVIQELLGEKVTTNQESVLSVPSLLYDNAPLTPETYLGFSRADRYTNTKDVIPLHFVRLSGEWNSQSEYIQSGKNSEWKYVFLHKMFTSLLLHKHCLLL